MSSRVVCSLALAGVLGALAACERSGREVVVYTSVDQPFSEPIFKAFKKHSGIDTRAVYDTEETKSTGVVNRLIAEASNPQADVFWSGDPVRPFLLAKRGIVEPYVSPNTAGVPAQFKAPDGTWTGSAARARILLVNKKRVSAEATPTSVRDLANPRWKGQTAIANPLFGTTTMHVAALFALWGDGRARAFLEDLRANDVRLASSNGEVKRLVAAGEVAFGLTDTDDANEALKDGADVEVVYPDQDSEGTLVMPTAVVLIKGPNRENGKRLVDYLVSADVERLMAKEAAHMPLRAGSSTPPGIRTVDQVRAMKVDYAGLGDVMERIQPWLREWTGL
jgi:iron(III) transport system substrate-binding protein